MKQTFWPLLAASIATTLTPIHALAGEWGIGLGVVLYEPPQLGAEPEIAGGPFPYYQGDRLSLSFGSISYALVQSDQFQFAALGQVRFDGYDPDNSSELTGMEKRNPAFDAGFSVSTGGQWGMAQLKVLGDLTGTHEGYEVSASYEIPYQIGRWTLGLGIGLNWRSKELVDYYYGVRASEARDGRSAYAGRSATNASVGLNVDYKLNNHLHILGGTEYVRLGDGITASPIIERNYETSVFTALLYRF